MIRLFSSKIYMLLPAAMLMLAACSDDDDNNWEPGEPEKASCIGVYFSADAPSSYVLLPTGDKTIEVAIYRQSSSSAVEVPIISTGSDERLSIPASVSFAAGQDSTSFSVDCSALPSQETAQLLVTVPEEYLLEYSSTLYAYGASVIITDWEEVNGSPVTLTFLNSSYEEAIFNAVECKMYNLGGTNQYRLENVFNSGLDLDFEIIDTDTKGYSEFSPLTNFYSDPTYYNEWYLFDKANNSYANPQLEVYGTDTSVTVNYIFFYGSSYSPEIRLKGSVDSNGDMASFSYCYMWGQAYSTSWNLFCLYFCWDTE
ncbi:MAG: hypothetical protein LIO90_11430 [Bacteroidales bacterium]|nr:hypothetical protein [Bacteroidales bacterium]